MVINGSNNAETRCVFMAELRKTQGWHILKEDMLAKRATSVRLITTGDPSNIEINTVIVNRARIKLLDEIISIIEAGAKEEHNAST